MHFWVLALVTLAGGLAISAVGQQSAAAPLALQIATSTVRPAGSTVPSVIVVLGVRQDMGEKASSASEVVDVRVEAFTSDGKSQGMTAYTTKVAFTRSVDAVIDYELLAKLTLPPGRYQIRATVRTVADGRSGRVFADADVPRRSSDAFEMSSIVFSTTPGLPSAPRSALAGVLPFVPTSLREFSRVLRVTAWAQLALSDDPLLHPTTFRARIVNMNDSEVFRDQRVITPAPLERNRLATYKVDIPLQNFLPGSYALSFFATSELRPPQQRDVRFTVQ